jgi:DNA-binding transcriptional LysR family regulator
MRALWNVALRRTIDTKSFEAGGLDILAAFRVFVRVAESGSFSAVAREMGLTQPAVSRQVSALETHLGARLLQRTTRSLALTSDGQDLLGHARSVLEAVERAEGAVGRHHEGPSGLVRVSSSVTFGRIVIAPRLPGLLERYPLLEVDLRLDDRPADLVHDGIDVAVRVGEISEASLIARRMGTVSLQVMGSPMYLAKHGVPRTLEDLAQHQCVIRERTPHPHLWRLVGAEGVRDVPVSGRFRTDSVEAARVAVNSGVGLAVLSDWLMQRELAAGTVVPVLTEWKPPSPLVNAVYPSQRNLAPRSRAVIDFLVAEFKRDRALSGG